MRKKVEGKKNVQSHCRKKKMGEENVTREKKKVMKRAATGFRARRRTQGEATSLY